MDGLNVSAGGFERRVDLVSVRMYLKLGLRKLVVERVYTLEIIRPDLNRI